MDLKTFVSESLKQIIDGVEEAQLQSKNSVINPAWRNEDGEGFHIRVVEFDVAVTLEKKSGSKGGIGVWAGAVGLGSQGQSKSSDVSVSRIKFSVQVVFQTDAKDPKFLERP